MKAKASSRQQIPPLKTVAFVSLGFAGLLAIILAVAVAWDSVGMKDQVVAAQSTPAAASIRRPSILWYIRMRQWHADARTVVAAVRYALEVEGQTNQTESSSRFRGLEVAMPANSTPVGPRA